MATVSFSIPDDVKADFDETLGGQNKSAVIAGLMRKAIAERKAIADVKQRERREAIFRTLMHRRAKRPSMRATR
jgi:metal-responsive CopG/Arc/MetJ family transcriptional regulator